MKLLAIDTQTFEILREKDCLYVDKTQYIHKMVASGRIFFLSRPRRFGKSLLISTIDALFSGKKELFTDLFIYDKWDWSRRYPVIRLDWTGIDHSSPENTKRSLPGYLQEQANKYKVKLAEDTAASMFRDAIVQLHEALGEKVVILIDEYDKPVTSHLTDGLLDKMRTGVHDLYQVMKNSDEHIQFIFITGVSKFSGLSVFSALNNPLDITLHRDYAAICGYTQQELETCFDEHINHAAQERGATREELLEKVRYWYDGYSWDGETRVYNPFSTSRFFANPERFVGYWYGSATPTFLIDIVKRHQTPDFLFNAIPTDYDTLYNGYSPEAPEEIPLMYQTGYITVNKVVDETNYELAIPNMEVEKALKKYLLKIFCTYEYDNVNLMREKIQRYTLAGNEDGLACVLMALFSVPYQIKDGKESAYHVAFQIALRALGFKIQSEVSTEQGRADAVWELPEMTVVAELKYSATLKPAYMLRKALKQIHTKRYYTPYMDGPVTLLAVAFTDGDVKCRIQKLF